MKVKHIFPATSFLLLLAVTSFALFTKGEEAVSTTPSQITSIEVNYKKPIYDTPTLIFKIKYNGIIVVRYNWTDRIGHSCNSLWLNFWDHEELTATEQENVGNLGSLWLTKCSNHKGTYNMTIQSKTVQTPMGIYFEVDNDQGYTCVQQDPLYLDIAFYTLMGKSTSLPFTCQ